MRAFRALEKGSELPTAPALVVSFVPSPGTPGSGRRDAKTARVWSNLPAVCKVDPGKNQELHVPAHEQRAGHARGPLCTSVSLSAKRGTPLAHFSAGGITQVIHQKATVAARLLCCRCCGRANISQSEDPPRATACRGDAGDSLGPQPRADLGQPGFGPSMAPAPQLTLKDLDRRWREGPAPSSSASQSEVGVAERGSPHGCPHRKWPGGDGRAGLRVCGRGAGLRAPRVRGRFIQ